MLYGRVEARIKLPAGYAIWPAFWMVGSNYPEVGWPQCGEIDIADMVGNGDTTTLWAGLHGPRIGDATDFEVVSSPPDSSGLTQDFHTYWANWQPDSIQLGIDSMALATYTPASLPPEGQWVFDAPMYAILNIAVGSKYTGPPNASTPFPATMLVDWFRYTPS